MEVSIINAIKKRRSKKGEEESNPMVEKDSIVKVNDVDINKTVKDFKDLVYNKLNLSGQIKRDRLF